MTRSTLSVRAFLLAALVLPPALASAHDLWIEPSSFHPARGEEVTATLLIGQHLEGEPFPRNPVLVDRFILKGRSAETSMSGEAGDDPAGTARAAEAGLHWIGYQSKPFPMVIDAATFEKYLKEEGLERISEERAKKGASASPGRERFSRCAKALLDVGTVKAAGGIFDQPLGFTLELVPRRNPYALAPGAELPVSLTFRGKPLVNALVVAISKDAPANAVSARTDAKGHASLKLAGAGFWLVKAVHMEPAPAGSGVDWESWWASVTFDLPSRADGKRPAPAGR